MEMSTVFRTFNPAEAQVIRGRLETAGIPATVRNENSAVAGGAGIAGVQFLVDVSASRAADARELINAPSPAE